MPPMMARSRDSKRRDARFAEDLVQAAVKADGVQRLYHHLLVEVAVQAEDGRAEPARPTSMRFGS